MRLLDGICFGGYDLKPREMIFVFNDIDDARSDLIDRINIAGVPARIYTVSKEPGSEEASVDIRASVIMIGVKAPTEDVL